MNSLFWWLLSSPITGSSNFYVIHQHTSMPLQAFMLYLMFTYVTGKYKPQLCLNYNDTVNIPLWYAVRLVLRLWHSVYTCIPFQLFHNLFVFVAFLVLRFKLQLQGSQFTILSLQLVINLQYYIKCHNPLPYDYQNYCYTYVLPHAQ